MKAKSTKEKLEDAEHLDQEFRKIFAIPKPEGVIEYYKTSSGTLYISQNFICFDGGENKATKIPLSRVTNIELQGVKGFRKILVSSQTESYVFSMFTWVAHTRQAFNLMLHVWKNPPAYVDMKAVKGFLVSYDKTRQEEQQQQKQKAKVNVDAARQLVKAVQDVDTMQNEAMKKLAEQGEQIDRINNKLDDINEDLKRADHLMKGIESMPYYLFGGSTKREAKKERVVKDHTIIVAPGTPPVIEVEVLFRGREALTTAIMLFEADAFKVLHQKTEKPLANDRYNYIDVDKIVIRSRHEFMDILFNTKRKDPVRLCSSYLQIITNQIHTRSKLSGHDVTVEFEGKDRDDWEYQDEWIYKLPPPKRGTGKTGLSSGNFQPLASLFGDPEQRKDMEEVDNALDITSNLLTGIAGKARGMNTEIIQQTENLKEAVKKTDEASSRMSNLNERMDKAS